MTKQADPEYWAAREACSHQPKHCEECPYNKTKYTTHQCIGVIDDTIKQLVADYNKKWKRNIKV